MDKMGINNLEDIECGEHVLPPSILTIITLPIITLPIIPVNLVRFLRLKSHRQFHPDILPRRIKLKRNIDIDMCKAKAPG